MKINKLSKYIIVPILMIVGMVLIQIEKVSAGVVEGGVPVTVESTWGDVNVYFSNTPRLNFANSKGYLGPNSEVLITMTASAIDESRAPQIFLGGSQSYGDVGVSRIMHEGHYMMSFKVYSGTSHKQGYIFYPVDYVGPEGGHVVGATFDKRTCYESGIGSVICQHSYDDNSWYGGETLTYDTSCTDFESGCTSEGETIVVSGDSSSGGTSRYDNVRNEPFRLNVRVNRDYTGPSSWYAYVNPSGWTRSTSLCGHCTSDSGVGCGADVCNEYITNGVKDVCARDKLNNYTCGTYNVTNIDREAPSCGAITKPNGNYWYKSNFIVKAGCDDNGKSGCTANPFAEWESTSSGSIYIQDALGNGRSCPFSGVAIDRTAPTINISYGNAYTSIDSKYQSSDSSVEVVLNASDSQSGVNRVCYNLRGATYKGDTCVAGSQAKVYVPKEGTTTINAWSYDNARDYNSSTGNADYNGGNKSSTANKQIWIDRTVPTIRFASANDGRTWRNTATPVSVSLSDSGSGLGEYRYYWSTSNGDEYNESTALYRGASGNIISANLGGSWTNNKSFTETHPTNNAHNDVLYLHVKACDRSFHTNNCTTATYKTGIHFDNMKPPVPNVSQLEQEWVNKFKLTIQTSENIQSGKQNSGLNTIYTYWDTNTNHKEEGMTRYNSSYSNSANLTNTNPGQHYNSAYNWTLDFADLKNKLRDGTDVSTGACAEGSRFIKIRVSDIAGNWSDPLLTGFYKWDTTKPEVIFKNITSTTDNFLPASAQ